MRLIGGLVLVVLLGVSSSGCKQALGERCAVQSDCDDGLVCVLPPGGNSLTGGTCQLPGGGYDAAVVSDLGSGVDAAVGN